jgi:hypothetical protein
MRSTAFALCSLRSLAYVSLPGADLRALCTTYIEPQRPCLERCSAMPRRVEFTGLRDRDSPCTQHPAPERALRGLSLGRLISRLSSWPLSIRRDLHFLSFSLCQRHHHVFSFYHHSSRHRGRLHRCNARHAAPGQLSAQAEQAPHRKECGCA